MTLEDKRFTPTDTGEVVTDKLIEHFPDVVDVTFTAYMEKELDDIAEGDLHKLQMLEEFYGPFERALEKAEHSFERFVEELDEECPLCPTEGREPGPPRGEARPLRQVRRVHELPRLPLHPQHGRQRAARARDARRDRAPSAASSCSAGSDATGRSPAAAATPTAATSRRTHRSRPASSCPQCSKGELIEKRSRFGSIFYSCSTYPDCDNAVGNPPEKDHPCPECGSLLLRRPKSLKCWGCGAELDLEFNVTKSGDVEAETAAREAKRAATGRARGVQEEDRREEADREEEEAGREEAEEGRGEEGACREGTATAASKTPEV